VADAEAVAKALRDLHFDKVILKKDLSTEAMRAALKEFGGEVAGAEVGVVFFAGHGTEIAGRNYLIPVDARLARAADVDLEAVGLDTVLGQLDGVRRLKLVILDACRNNIFPLAGAKRAVTRGLARVEPDDNTLVAYAAKEGTAADDGEGRRHSPFTEALLKHPGLEVDYLFRLVRDDVLDATGRQQVPNHYNGIGRERIYLVPPPSQTAAPAPTPAAPAAGLHAGGEMIHLLPQAQVAAATPPRVPTPAAPISTVNLAKPSAGACKLDEVAVETGRGPQCLVPGSGGGGAKGERRKKTVPVDSFQPNPWGLYQMHGNVSEWTEDCWSGDYKDASTDGSARTTNLLSGDCFRTVRGGDWDADARDLSAASRSWNNPDNWSQFTGFRVARSLSP
jgi:hypothetical protein